MLKSNSKQARENVRKYIIDKYHPEGYENAPDENADFAEIALFLRRTVEKEKFYANLPFCEKVFLDWVSGLPPALDTCYYYNRSAIKDVCSILEQDEAEARSRFTEPEAEILLTHIIFREINTVTQRNALYSKKGETKKAK